MDGDFFVESAASAYEEDLSIVGTRNRGERENYNSHEITSMPKRLLNRPRDCTGERLGSIPAV